MTATLFSEGRIGSLNLPNRIVMTAMGTAQAATDGSVTDLEVAFYRERARGGVGLIITECMIVDWASGHGNLHQTAATEDAHIAGLTRLALAVHEEGGKLVGQLYHPGRQGFLHVNGTETQPAPSDIPDAMTQVPVHAMTVEEIAALVEKFGEAARRLQQAGFDGVEIHGAHGYLLTSFLSPASNLRTDEYGGNTENRARIVTEIIAKVREYCGPDFPLLVRISASEYLEMAGKPGQGIDIDEGVALARCLEAAGADALDVSSGIYETMNSAWEPFSYEEGWKSSLAARVKEAVSVPVIGVSVYRHAAFAENLLAQGMLDFVGSARAHFADPFWSAKAKAGEILSVRRCISCLSCMESLVIADETGGPSHCAINPRTGRELDVPVADGAGRKVVVVGAGPAGLEAAVTAAERGFAVTLFEREDRIGGQLNYAVQPPGKGKINWMLVYYAERIRALGIDLHLNSAVTPEELARMDAHAVLLAVGSEPIMPRAIPGLDGDNVYEPPTVLTGEVDLAGKKIVVIGSGMTGIETTHLLAEQGCELALFEMLPDIGPGVYFQNLMDLMPRLAAHKVQLYPSHKLLSIEGNRAAFEKEDGSRFEAEAEAFVVSLGTRPLSAYVAEVQELIPGAVAIGDSSKPGRIRDATRTGWEAAVAL
ncbi:MAG: FAD-dependent oxidoreductase [Coriobacteriales bacterium]|jgi:2,4-dienoyl-CoA reductase-like NADH-dependent reductase (Old Yellow Enzyme family)/thioredoxin reductase|nr:FAD-dependent oxidoreductase [Coriobacteriales bacterium]